MSDLEPLYSLKVAAELIPFTNAEALRKWLSRRQEEFPPRYMPKGRWCWVRMLTQGECARIRQSLLRTGQWSQISRAR